MNKVFTLIALISLSFLSACSDAPVGSKKRPFTMYFIPSVDAEKMTNSAKGLTDYVQTYVSQKLYGADSGFYVKGAVPTSYIAVVEALGTNKADFAAFSTFAYILTKDIKKYDIEAVLTVVRGEDTTYKAQIITRADSGINDIKDLNGKNFAYTDPASTSGYILPAQLLKEQGVKLGRSVFAQKHDNVVTMVYQGQVDAGATYYSPPSIVEENGKKITKIMDARSRVLTQFPDVEEKIKIIGFSKDIPNEPWVLRSNLMKDPQQNTDLKRYIVEAIVAFSKTPEGLILIDLIASATGLVPVDDNVYKEIRDMVKDTDLNIENIIGKKG